MKKILESVFWVVLGIMLVAALCHSAQSIRLTNVLVAGAVGTAVVLLVVVFHRPEVETAGEKPFRSRHIGGIEVHYYRDGTRIVWCDGQMVDYQVGNPLRSDSDPPA